MGKKKGGKRLGKKQVTELLQNLFQHHPNETFSFKQIFKALKFDTHPLKMLAIDTMEVVRRMAVTRSCPTMVVRQCLWQSVTRCRRWTVIA